MIPSQFRRAISPLGGLISRVVRVTNTPGDPEYSVCSALLGDLSKPLATVEAATGGRFQAGEIDGAGSALDLDTAVLRAIGESFERYATCVYSEQQFIWANAAELGDEALDLDLLPRCSEIELSHPQCQFRLPDKQAPIRWVRGVSLMTRRPVWVPAVMVYLHIPARSMGERFTQPISTGCAAHPVIEQALVSAICEVIERDGISLAWLQELALPRIELDVVPDSLTPYIERNRHNDFTTLFFDATTDVGIPTVYSVDVAPNHPRLATLVMASTDLNPVRCVEKVLRESASSRVAMQQPTRKAPANPDQFQTVFDGAVYMGSFERLPAFRFLFDSASRRRLSEMPSLDTGDPSRNLQVLIERLAAMNMEAFAVDLTTDEALRCGLRVVRVIIPQLQPLSFSHRARFLAHPRLYEAPKRMGYPVRSEADLNPWPQPFA